MAYPAREVRHASGLVEFVPDPREEARRILDEYGLAAICEIFERLRAVEAANSAAGGAASTSMGAGKHPIEDAVARFLDNQAALAERLAKGGSPCSKP